MKNRNKPPAAPPKPRNWVAKNARLCNKVQVFADRTRYRRKPKHRERPESWPVAA